MLSCLSPLCSRRLFDSSEEQVEQSEEDKPEDVPPQPASQSYAATVALPSTPPSATTLMGRLPPATQHWHPELDTYQLWNPKQRSS